MKESEFFSTYFEIATPVSAFKTTKGGSLDIRALWLWRCQHAIVTESGEVP